MARRVAATLALLTICALMPASAGAVARFGPAQLASAGPTGGNGPYDVGGALGTPGVESRAYFETNEALVAEDGDQARDVYETDGRRVSLVSAGTPTAGKPLGATLGGSSLDGARAFFNTYEPLVPEDADRGEYGLDVYERAAGLTTLISSINPACTECNFWFAGASDDGRHVFFEDGYDVYESFQGVVTLVSTGPTARPGSIDSVETFLGSSADGAHAFFHSRDNLVPEDHDNCGSPGVITPCSDFFERTGGATHLISTGPSGGNASIQNPYGNSFAASRDGEHSVFATAEPLVPEDTDTSQDLYERTAGQTRLVSTGPSSAGAASFPTINSLPRITNSISEDGSRIFFTTDEQLVPEDQDARRDVYLRAGGTTTLISTGPVDGGDVGADFERATPSGDHVFFRASGALTARDTDSLWDLYEWSAEGTELVSVGSAGGNSNCENEQFPFACEAGSSGASRDGSRVFFHTEESLVRADTDQEFDVYVRRAGKTVLVTRGTIGGNGPFHASSLAVPPSGKALWFTTAERLVPRDTDDRNDLYVAYERPSPRCFHRPRPRFCDRD